MWSVRDRDAEAIRALLRKGGHREFTDLHGGFAVEGANSSLNGGEPFLVGCADGDDAFAAAELAAYIELLRGAGYAVTVDPDDEEILEVRPPAAAPVRWPLRPPATRTSDDDDTAARHLGQSAGLIALWRQMGMSFHLIGSTVEVWSNSTAMTGRQDIDEEGRVSPRPPRTLCSSSITSTRTEAARSKPSSFTLPWNHCPLLPRRRRGEGRRRRARIRLALGGLRHRR